MKYLIYSVLLIIFPALLSTNAEAVDAKNGYMILGPGAYSCERIIADLERDAKDKNPASVIVYSNWLAGDLTAYNRDAKSTYSILGDTSFTEAFAWAVQYCHDRPSDIYAAAADALITRLKPHRAISMPSPPEQEEDDDKDDDEEEK